MTPITLDLEDIGTNVTTSDYDRWKPVAYYAPELQAVVNRELDRLETLAPNWDAEGALIIDRQIIQTAREFLTRLPEHLASIPAVVPSASGTLQYEWNDGPRSLELEFETPTTIHYLKWDSQRKIEEEDIFDIKEMGRAVSLIRWFMGSFTDV